MTLQLLTVALGLLVGLSLGALGGGGSTLALPVLVFVAGLEANDATTASLFVVGIAALIGVIGHYRNGNVRLGAGLAFGAAGILGARAGTWVNQSLPEKLLLLTFSALILFVALRMLKTARSDAPEESTPPAHVPSGTVLVKARPAAPVRLTPALIGKLALAATGVGFLTGMFGVGGGFAVVPALTLFLGFQTKEAIGTSLVVIAINAGVALTIRSGDLAIDWAIILPFLATVTIGVLVGSSMSTRVDAQQLTRSFALMLGAVAAYTALNAVMI